MLRYLCNIYAYASEFSSKVLLIVVFTVHKVLALRRHRNEASEMAADYYRKHVLVRFCLPL